MESATRMEGGIRVDDWFEERYTRYDRLCFAVFFIILKNHLSVKAHTYHIRLFIYLFTGISTLVHKVRFAHQVQVSVYIVRLERTHP